MDYILRTLGMRISMHLHRRHPAYSAKQRGCSPSPPQTDEASSQAEKQPYSLPPWSANKTIHTTATGKANTLDTFFTSQSQMAAGDEEMEICQRCGQAEPLRIYKIQ